MTDTLAARYPARCHSGISEIGSLTRRSRSRVDRVSVTPPHVGRGEERLAGRGVALFRLARRKCTRAFMSRAHIEAIEQPEVRIADYFEAPQQRQAERATDSAGDFRRQRKTAQRLDANFDARLFFGGVHWISE